MYTLYADICRIYSMLSECAAAVIFRSPARPRAATGPVPSTPPAAAVGARRPGPAPALFWVFPNGWLVGWLVEHKCSTTGGVAVLVFFAVSFWSVNGRIVSVYRSLSGSIDSSYSCSGCKSYSKCTWIGVTQALHPSPIKIGAFQSAGGGPTQSWAGPLMVAKLCLKLQPLYQ